MPDELRRAVLELKRDEALKLVKLRLESGDDPLAILDACRGGMTRVGERFQSGAYYLSELLLSAEIFKEATALLEVHLSQRRARAPRGKVVLATMKGDIHDLGKNILATLFRAQGFDVHDLGVDVGPAVLVEQVVALRPQIVGFSSLITIAFPSMKEAAQGLARAGVRDGLKLLIGGGVTNPQLRDHVGADFQTLDAVEGVAYCLRAIEGEGTWRSSE
jgi:methylmalonyl-CoA mutase cobalamin-binding domain/chain